MNWIFVTIDRSKPMGAEETLQGRFDNYQHAHDAMFQYMQANHNAPCYVKSVSSEDFGV